MDDDLERAFPLSALTYQIIDCFFEVFRELGHGFSEIVYQRALAIVLLERGFDVAMEEKIPVHFHGQSIGTFEADLVVNGMVIVEIKATETIENYAIAQCLNYLKAAGGGVGLILNCGRKPQHKRFVFSNNPADSLPALRRKS
jgi:GxxExxY protein